MADTYGTMNTEAACSTNFKEAVCIDAFRVYDSCGDKDCLEDLRVYFTEAGQACIDQASNVRMRSVEVMMVYVDLEPVPFHKGFYAVDMTFFFNVALDVFQAPAAPPITVCGLSLFNKRVVLYGSEGNVKIFSSDYSREEMDSQNTPIRNLPKASVQVCEYKLRLRGANPALFRPQGYALTEANGSPSSRQEKVFSPAAFCGVFQYAWEVPNTFGSPIRFQRSFPKNTSSIKERCRSSRAWQKFSKFSNLNDRLFRRAEPDPLHKLR